MKIVLTVDKDGAILKLDDDMTYHAKFGDEDAGWVLFNAFNENLNKILEENNGESSSLPRQEKEKQN